MPLEAHLSKRKKKVRLVRVFVIDGASPSRLISLIRAGSWMRSPRLNSVAAAARVTTHGAPGPGLCFQRVGWMRVTEVGAGLGEPLINILTSGLLPAPLPCPALPGRGHPLLSGPPLPSALKTPMPSCAARLGDRHLSRERKAKVFESTAVHTRTQNNRVGRRGVSRNGSLSYKEKANQ